jgi:ectoine hydroxylase-related dioxygenase (phytanoyl-CoA dioxygenase family)
VAFDHFEPTARADALDVATSQLADRGFCVIRELVAADQVRALHDDLRPDFERTPFSIGEFYGSRTKRFGGVLKRSAHAESLVRHPLIMDIAERVLGPWCDVIQLNLTQAIEIHPGELIQAPHRDQDMWRVSRGKVECLINVMWPFTDYTVENGATLVWPESHKDQKNYHPDFSQATPAEMSPGSALVWLGSTLHGGGANRTDAPRTGLIVSYCLGWLRTFENQFLAYPPEVARTFSPELARLVGYQQHRPSLGNHEGRCPSELLSDRRTPDHAPFEDTLPDWQCEAVTQFKTVIAPHIRLGAHD